MTLSNHYLKLLTLVSVFSLAGCGATGLAKINVPDNLKSQPAEVLVTEGSFWGLGKSGSFDFVGQYSGRYNRKASGSSWLGATIETNKGSMAAEITNSATQDTWQLTCGGGVNAGDTSLGSNAPYTCKIFQNEKKVGDFILKKTSGLDSFGPSGKVSGSVSFAGQRFAVKSVHKTEGSIIQVDAPLGYYVLRGSENIAAIQTNGAISLRQTASASQSERDILVISMVATALSWRP